MIKTSASRKVFVVCNVLALVIVSLVFLLPYVMIISASISDEIQLITKGYSIFPRGFSMKAYSYIFTKSGAQDTSILRAFANSVFITLVSSVVILLVTGLYAYPLSRSYLKGKKFFNWLMIIPMLFGGGMIPTFIIVSYFFYDSMLALIIPGAMAPYYGILMRNFFMGIPDSLEEAAKIDGASDLRVYFKIILPLSKPLFATIFLYAAVAAWNNWMGPLLYITDASKYPLQYFTQKVMTDINSIYSGNQTELMPTESVKMACVVIGSLPIICIYPFIQKYFIQGTNVGAVKE